MFVDFEYFGVFGIKNRERFCGFRKYKYFCSRNERHRLLNLLKHKATGMLIFDIKRYAINDGPGIRTTIFMKGCPLRCVWCHNPESWLPEPEMLFKQSKCIGCNTCGLYPDNLPPKHREVFPIDCPATALEQCGREWTLEELMAEVEKERDVMTDSGGGVTLCGGEPLMQPQACLAILQELGRRGLHRTVDTSLYASPEVVRAVAAETDLFLIDLKHMDSERHRELTGVPNEPILHNVRLLSGKEVWFRLPLIEGINDDEANIEATARFVASLPPLHHPSPQGAVRLLHLLPYHDVGKDKHRRRGTKYNPQGLTMKAPSDTTIERCRQQLQAHGIQVVVGG